MVETLYKIDNRPSVVRFPRGSGYGTEKLTEVYGSTTLGTQTTARKRIHVVNNTLLIINRVSHTFCYPRSPLCRTLSLIQLLPPSFTHIIIYLFMFIRRQQRVTGARRGAAHRQGPHREEGRYIDTYIHTYIHTYIVTQLPHPPSQLTFIRPR